MSTELAKRATAIGQLLEQNAEAIKRALPKHLTAERLIRVASTAIFRNPALIECDQRSIVNAVVIASQMGLEPDGVMGMAYMVPYKNKKGGRIAQLIVGYRGYVDLARRSGEIADLYSESVYSCDKFEITKGTKRNIEHVPNYDHAEYGKLIAFLGVYAVAILKNGEPHFEYMPKKEIDAIRARSAASNSGPWVTDYVEMARKTVVRRLCKMLPMSVELRTAIATQDAVDQGIPQGGVGFIDIPFEDADEGADAAVREPATTPEGQANEAAESATDTRTPDEWRTKLLDQIGADMAIVNDLEVLDSYVQAVANTTGQNALQWPDGWDRTGIQQVAHHVRAKAEKLRKASPNA